MDLFDVKDLGSFRSGQELGDGTQTWSFLDLVEPGVEMDLQIFFQKWLVCDAIGPVEAVEETLPGDHDEGHFFGGRDGEASAAVVEVDVDAAVGRCEEPGLRTLPQITKFLLKNVKNSCDLGLHCYRMDMRRTVLIIGGLEVLLAERAGLDPDAVKVEVFMISAQRIHLVKACCDLRVMLNVPLAAVSAVAQLAQGQSKLVRLTARRADAMQGQRQCLSDQTHVCGAVA